MKKAGLGVDDRELAVPDRGQDQLVDGEREHDRGQDGLDRTRVAAGDVDDEVLHEIVPTRPTRSAQREFGAHGRPGAGWARDPEPAAQRLHTVTETDQAGALARGSATAVVGDLTRQLVVGDRHVTRITMPPRA